MRVGIVQYINALPFYLPFHLNQLHTEHTIQLDIPRQLTLSLQQKTLDVALTSCIAYFDNPYQLLPGYCIGAHKEILSVNLYLRGPLHKGRIGLTQHSQTAIELLKVLCIHFWHVQPIFLPLNTHEKCDGLLLIGDDALKHMTIPGYQTIDLAHAWYEATQLPFVFAVIAMQREISFPDDLFAPALAWSERNRDLLVEAAHNQCGLPKSLIHKYYDTCIYRLGERELHGLNLFKQLRKDVSKISP